MKYDYVLVFINMHLTTSHFRHLPHQLDQGADGYMAVNRHPEVARVVGDRIKRGKPHVQLDISKTYKG